MAVNKIYQDSVIAGGSIRDGQGKRIDTTYAKKSDIPDAYTKTEVNNLLVDKADIEDIPAPYILPMASVDTLGGVKVDNTTIGIDSNGVISSKVTSDVARIEEALVDKTNMAQASIASIVSDKYEDLTLLASNQPYIAPENGYFYLNKSGSSGQYIAMLNQATDISLFSEKNSSGSPRMLYRVKKGDKIIITYTTTGTTYYFRFYYDISTASSV